MSGFLSRRTPAPLTTARFAGTVTACLILTAIIVAVAPLISLELTRAGRALTFADLRDPMERMLYVDSRLPRALTALLVGAALAAAGCAFQALLRNPLAEPFTLGISSGASLVAVLAIRLGAGAALGTLGVSGAAALGAGLTLYVVWQLGRVGNGLPSATLLLAGVTIAMFCSAASLLIQHTADFVEMKQMLRWMMGSFTDVVGYRGLERITAPLLAGIAALIYLGRDLNALAAGPEAASSVGVNPGRVQTTVFVVSSVLVGASIGVAGPIGFVGLIVPHAVRAMLGPDHRLLLPCAAITGGGLLVLCDTVARLAHQLPVGIITALLGGPFFIAILILEKRQARLFA